MDNDNSLNIIQRLLKSFLPVHAIVIEGTVSQIFYLGPSSRFMCFQNLCSQYFSNVSLFLAQNKNEDLNKKSETQFPPYGSKE